jgi:hypothetical protein
MPWAFAARLGPHASRSRICRARQRLLVRGGDLSCEAETSRARWRFVVWGGDLSCGAETSCGGPSSGELVGDAANWPKTGRLASVSLDQGPYSSLSWIFAMTLSLSMVLDYHVCKEDFFAVKGAPNPGSRHMSKLLWPHMTQNYFQLLWNSTTYTNLTHLLSTKKWLCWTDIHVADIPGLNWSAHSFFLFSLQILISIISLQGMCKSISHANRKKNVVWSKETEVTSTRLHVVI